jgi:hypothetical protein
MNPRPDNQLFVDGQTFMVPASRNGAIRGRLVWTLDARLT